jgi:transposase-like protein
MFQDVPMKTNTAALKEEAAVMVAEGRYDYQQIAEKLGVTARALHKWRKQPVFAARVEELSKEFGELALKRGIARKEYRLKCLADRQSKLLQVIEERSSDPSMIEVPGGKTGLVVRQIIASAGELVGYEYSVDTGTLRELREVETMAAKELGQIVEKSESKVDATVTERQMSDEQLERNYRDTLGRAETVGAPAKARQDSRTSSASGDDSPAELEELSG